MSVDPLGTAPMFDLDLTVAVASDEEPERLSPDRRRTRRQMRDLLSGRHPATRVALHPQAAAADDRKAEGLRCRDCQHLLMATHHVRSYLKCELAGVSHSAASDVRAWWPACQRYDAGTTT